MYAWVVTRSDDAVLVISLCSAGIVGRYNVLVAYDKNPLGSIWPGVISVFDPGIYLTGCAADTRYNAVLDIQTCLPFPVDEVLGVSDAFIGSDDKVGTVNYIGSTLFESKNLPIDRQVTSCISLGGSVKFVLADAFSCKANGDVGVYRCLTGNRIVLNW